MSLPLACLVVIFLLTAGVYAGEKAALLAAASEAAVPVGAARGQVNIDVKQRPLRDVLQYFERVGGWNIVPMDERVGDIQITIHVTNMFWRDALDVIATKEKLLVKEDAKNRVVYIDKPPPITMAFADTDVRMVINAIAKAGNASVIIGPNVQGSVTMNLQDIPWREALDIVLKTLGYVLVQEKHGVLRVATPAELEQQMETRVFRLSYLMPKGASYIATIDTEFATRIGGTKGAKEDLEDSLKSVLEKVRSSNGSIAFEKRTNSVIVTDTPAKLESISAIIRQLDVPPKQVHFSIRMIELNDSDKEMLGMEWANGFTASASGMGFATLFPFPNGAANNVLQGSGLPGDVGLGLNGGILTKAKVSPVNPVADPQISLGSLDFTSLQAVLNFVKKHTAGRIIQAPELMCLDNEEATIQVGDLVRYAESQVETTPSGGTTSGWKEGKNSPVKLGVQILVIPHVTGPENNILLTVIPKIESPRQPLFEEFVSPSLGTLKLPQTSQRIVVTKMLLRNGETGVIAGIRNELKNEVVTKVPLLGDIPIVGWLFRSRSRPEDTNKSTNLIILVTGTVIDFLEKNDLELRLAPAQRQLRDIFQVYGEE